MSVEVLYYTKCDNCGLADAVGAFPERGEALQASLRDGWSGGYYHTLCPQCQRKGLKHE